jgi:hypothetical protein
MSMLIVNVNIDLKIFGGRMWVGLIGSRLMAVCCEHDDEPSF